jgi:hypothetical protein
MKAVVVFCFLAAVVFGFPVASPPAPSTQPQSCLFLALECLGVSNALSYVTCNTTTHQCQCYPTFSGNASPASKCSCPTQVYFTGSAAGGASSLTDAASQAAAATNNFLANWIIGGPPICLDVNYYLSLVAETNREANHIASVLQFINNTVFPNPVKILATLGVGTLNNLLNVNVKSRISPAGTFNGFQGVVEYFYGFVANPLSSISVLSYDLLEIAAQGSIVGAKANLFIVNPNYAQTFGYPPQFFNLSLFMFFTFDSNDLIESIDVSVPNLGDLLDIPSTSPYFTAVHTGTIQETCAVMTLDVVKPNGTCGGYDTWSGPTEAARYQDCVTFQSSIVYGDHYRINANNFVCRALHTLLTPYSPDVHCPHAGKTGGNACIDFTYASFFATDY